MEISVTKNIGGIEGLSIIKPKLYGDDRGYFIETYNYNNMLMEGFTDIFVQDNQSKSVKGVLRGLHFQIKHPQAKLVRVIKGSVFDVVVDIRKDSKTFGKWYGIELSEDNKKQLYVPKGFAHGFLVLSDSAEFCYKVTDYYHPDDEGGIAWNDPKLNIQWPDVFGEYKGTADSSTYRMGDGTLLKMKDKDKRWLGIDNYIDEVGL